MLSNKVDLTEHGDFHTITLSSVLFLDGDVINRAVRANSMNTLSNEEYETIVTFEKFFGITLHTDKSWEVFHKKDDEVYRYEMSLHCQRCGKLLRIPWNSHNGLCGECDDEMERHSVRPDKVSFPWYPKYQAISRDTARDVLNMR